MIRHIGDIQEDILKRHLNLNKIFELSKKDKKIVMKLYNDLMDAFDPKQQIGMPQMDPTRIHTIYNTLIENDYLVTKRESNLDKVLS